MTAEKKYSINFTVTRKKFCLSLHYNEANSYLLVNGTQIFKLKAKYSETVATPLCLANVSKYFSVDNMKKTGFYGYAYDFSVDYWNWNWNWNALFHVDKNHRKKIQVNTSSSSYQSICLIKVNVKIIIITVIKIVIISKIKYISK